MFDDYVLYLVENLHSQERAAELLRVIKGEQTHGTCDHLTIVMHLKLTWNLYQK